MLSDLKLVIKNQELKIWLIQHFKGFDPKNLHQAFKQFGLYRITIY